MKPEANSLYNEDALILAEKLDDELFDLIYIDPPWGQNEDDLPIEDFNYEEFLYRILQQCYRLLKPTGHLFFHAAPMAQINFQALIEKVFDRDGIRAQFILPIKWRTTNWQRLGHDYNTLFLYSKLSGAPLEKTTRNRTDQEKKAEFPYTDERGQYNAIPLILSVDILKFGDFEWEGVKPPKGCYWIRNKMALTMLKARGRIGFSKKDRFPYLKTYETDAAKPVLGSIWDDIEPVDKKREQQWAKTQPKAFFDRIIDLGSRKQGWVFDPFCGMGGNLESASLLERNWVGNDLSEQAIKLTTETLIEAKIKPIKQKLSKAIPTIWNAYDSLVKSPEELLREQIATGENSRLEFKEALKLSRNQSKATDSVIIKVLTEICAFMNSTKGGRIIIGVSDEQEVLGIDEDLIAVNKNNPTEDNYGLFLSDKIKHQFNGDAIGTYDIAFFTLDDKRLCLIDIQPSKSPVFYLGDFYSRNITQSVKLKTEEAIQYINKHFKQR